MAHPQTNFSSNFQGVDPPLEGYWHDDPIPCGGGNVVTDIWPNPAGIPVVVKGFNALTDEDIADKLDNTGDASNTTATFSTASTRTNIVSGEKLSVLFGKIAKWFGDLGTAAFKTLVTSWSGTTSNDNIPSEKLVKDSLDGKADKANITGATKCKITYNGQGIVTSGTGLDASDIPGLPASKITSDTFDEARIPTSLPNTGVKYLLPLVHFSANNITSSTQYALIAQKRYSGNDTRPGEMFRLFYNDVFIDFKTYGLIKPSSQTASLSVAPLQSFGMGQTDWADRLHVTWTNDPSAQTIDVNIYFKFNVGENKFVTLYQYNGQAGGDRYNYTWTPYQGIESQYAAAAAGTEATYEWDRAYLFGSALYASKIGSYGSHPQIGSRTTPVYIDSDGQVKPCTQGSTLKSNTATLYIAGTFGEGNIPYYNVKDIKNGCVNYVHVKDIPSNTCSITIEAPALASGEEYDYVVVFDTFTNSNLIGSIDVENCKTAGHMDNGVFVVDSMILSSANPQYVPMIVVEGNVASSKWYDRT